MSQAMNTSKKNLSHLALLTLLALGGCAGDPAISGEGAPLFDADIAALPTTAASMLDEAPDCEGRLGNIHASNLRFEVASLTAGLVAVVDGMGSVVCVDSVTDVQSDLDSSGQSAEADAVAAGFLAAVHQADGRDARFSGRALAGDPEPQPNMRAGRLPDPEPQPN